MRLAFLILAAICGCVEIALGWGAEGHRAIGLLAQELLSSETQVKVEQLLKECGEKDLASASTWADDVREHAQIEGPRPKDADAFNDRFPNNPAWHFVDLPLGTHSFDEAQRFMNGEDDVVHIIERCIAVLEAHSSIPGELSQTQALRLLIHFVGDIHQPLHCGTGFYRLSETKPPILITKPEEALGLPNDRGGNDLFYAPRQQLHGLWDRELVQEIADTLDYHLLAANLRQEYFRNPVLVTPGDYHHWPETWALDSVKVANFAFAGIRFKSAETMEKPSSLWISIELPDGYEERNRAIAAQQLVKASAHLAQLLDRLRWP